MKIKLAFICIFAILCGAASASDWNRPGENPFMLSVPDAIDAYQQIPLELRFVLKIKMQKRQPDDTVLITRDDIVGQGGQRYGGMHSMFWGSRAKPYPGPVDRSSWAAGDVQRGFIYCAGPWCVLVPFICRNVALIDRLEAEEKPAASGSMHVVEAPPMVEDAPTFLASSDVEAGEIAGAGPIYLPASITYLTNAPLIVTVLQPGAPVSGGMPPVVDVLPPGAPVSPVPEPSTWATLVAGLAVVGFLVRRKRVKA